VPKWARASGGEGGAHPSNLIEYGYPLGTLNWTGDDPCLFPIDCPDFGGFVSSTTVIKAEWWRLGQLKPGNTLRYHRVSLEDALTLREREAKFIKEVASFAAGEIQDSKINPLKYDLPPSENWGSALVHHIEPQGHRPQVNYRQVSLCFLSQHSEG
jgi:urea carboxylase